MSVSSPLGGGTSAYGSGSPAGRPGRVQIRIGGLQSEDNTLEKFDPREILHLQGPLRRTERDQRSDATNIDHGGSVQRSRGIGRVQVQQVRLQGEHAEKPKTDAPRKVQLQDIRR